MERSEKPTALITGAGIGIGAATARAFARAGYRVIVTDILEGEGRSVADNIESAGGVAEYYHLDVMDTGETNSVVSAVQDRYGPIDIVVANAGIAHRVPLAELTDEKWDHTHEIDLKGVIGCAGPRSPPCERRDVGT
jgi:3-oxoacyl-[acyl-carrier protein] reductase